MSANDTALPIPADFDGRCNETYARLKAGEEMTSTQIAEQLGLPVEFFAAAMAVYRALIAGQPVIVDPTIATPPSSSIN